MSGSPPITSIPSPGVGAAATPPSFVPPPKTLSQKVWNVVKPIFVALTILAGIAAAVGIAYGVTLGLPVALLGTAIAVGGIALIYAFSKGVHHCYISHYKKQYPAIAKQIDHIYEYSDLDSLKSYVRLHEAKKFLTEGIAEKQKDLTKNKFWVDTANKIISQINAEINEYETDPSCIYNKVNNCYGLSYYIEWCQFNWSKSCIFTKALVREAEERNYVQRLIDYINKVKAIDAKKVDRNFQKAADMAIRSLQEEFKKADQTVINQYYYKGPMLDLPGWQFGKRAIDYVTSIAAKRDLYTKNLERIHAEMALPNRQQDPIYMAIAKNLDQLKIQEALDKLDLEMQVDDVFKDPNRLVNYVSNRRKYYEEMNAICQSIEQKLEKKKTEQTTPALMEARKKLSQEIDKFRQDLLCPFAVSPPAYVSSWEALHNAVENIKKAKTEQTRQKDQKFQQIADLVVKQLQEQIEAIDPSIPLPGFCASEKATHDYLTELSKLHQEIDEQILHLQTEVEKMKNEPPDKEREVRLKNWIQLLEKGKENPLLPSAPYFVKKHARISKAVKYIKNAQGIDKKVHDYFQKTLAKLTQGIDVPLPDYYHATRYLEGFQGIIKIKQIKKSVDGARGQGVYISTNNEGHYGYGPYTFAIDEAILKNTTAKFFYGRESYPTCNDTYKSLWVAVLKEIPIAENVIAFIDTSAAYQIPMLNQQLATANLNIEVIERSTSDGIRKVFDATTECRETPSRNWSGYAADLPANMRLCTS